MNGKFRIGLLASIAIASSLALCLAWRFQTLVGPVRYGATFSPDYARGLGLDAGQAYLAMLDELNLQVVRLPVQWYSLQPESSGINFTDLDWYVDQAARHNVKVILAIGNKVPRWPECYAPGWTVGLSQTEYRQALLSYIDQVVTHYRTEPNLDRWQVENEPFLAFGNCPRGDFQLIKQEISHVKALDNLHDIQLTVSGEQQLWASLAGKADVAGTSLYRRVAMPNGWLVTFPIPAQWYTLQALSVAFLTDKVVISELQAEPWLTQDYKVYSSDEAAALFTPLQLQTYFNYARRTGIHEISVWGVEWWYYLKQNGRPELWEAGKILLKTQN